MLATSVSYFNNSPAGHPAAFCVAAVGSAIIAYEMTSPARWKSFHLWPHGGKGWLDYWFHTLAFLTGVSWSAGILFRPLGQSAPAVARAVEIAAFTCPVLLLVSSLALLHRYPRLCRRGIAWSVSPIVLIIMFPMSLPLCRSL